MRLFDVMTEEREKDGEDWKFGFRCTEKGHSLCLHSTALRSFAMSGEGEEHQYNKGTIKPELLEKKIDWLALLPAPLNRHSSRVQRPRAMRNAAPSPAWTSIPANYLPYQTSLANKTPKPNLYHPPLPFYLHLSAIIPRQTTSQPHPNQLFTHPTRHPTIISDHTPPTQINAMNNVTPSRQKGQIERRSRDGMVTGLVFEDAISGHEKERSETDKLSNFLPQQPASIFFPS